MITKTRFVLAVPDLQASATFYRDMLGFEVKEMGDPGWPLFVKDACHIMAGECPDAIPPKDLGDHSYFAYLQVDGIDAYFESLKAKGAVFIKPLRNEPWGMREFGVRTADGHRIMVGCPIG